MPHLKRNGRTFGIFFFFYLVNLNEVTKYVRGEGGYLVMNDGSTVNVSRSRKEALMKFF